MYEDGGNAEEQILFCHACITPNRKLTVVGEYIDIYTKICDISYMEGMASEINLCWECIALLKKIRSFKRKVENAQKVLDFCIDTQIPLYSLSSFTISSTEKFTIVPKDIDEYKSEELGKSDIRIESDLKDDPDKLDIKNEDHYDLKELKIKIEDVRSQYEAAKADLDISLNSNSGCEECEASTDKVSPAPPGPDQVYQRWKQSIMLVHKRICGHQHAQHFQRPVSDDIAPHYSRVVRRPAALGTLRRRVRDGSIRTTAQYERALLLMFSNALMYNSSQDPIYRMAVELRTEALRELSLLSDPPPCSPRTRRRSLLHAPPAPPTPPRAHNNNTTPLPEPDAMPKAIVRRRASHTPKHNKVTSLFEADVKPAAVRRRRATQRPREADSTPLSEPEFRPAGISRRRATQGPREASSTPLSEPEPESASVGVGRRRASQRPREGSSTPPSEPEPKSASVGVGRRRASQRPREASSTPPSEAESISASVKRHRASQRPREANSTPTSETESKPASVGRHRASQRPREASSTPPSEVESKSASVGRRRASQRPREASSTPVSEPESKPASVGRRRASQKPREANSTPLSEPESRPAGIPRRRASQWAEPRPQEAKKLEATKRRASAWNWLPLDLDSELLVARHSTKKYKTVLL